MNIICVTSIMEMKVMIHSFVVITITKILQQKLIAVLVRKDLRHQVNESNIIFAY